MCFSARAIGGAVLGLLLSGGLGPAAAYAQRVAPVIPEARLDLLVARSAAVQAGAGVSLPVGVYIRPTIIGGAGPSWKDGESGVSARVDALGRFLLDPFRESSLGLYAAGGLTTTYDRWERWRAGLVLVLGAELPSRAGGAWVVELGLGRGVRVGLGLRRAVPERR